MRDDLCLLSNLDCCSHQPAPARPVTNVALYSTEAGSENSCLGRAAGSSNSAPPVASLLCAYSCDFRAVMIRSFACASRTTSTSLSDLVPVEPCRREASSLSEIVRLAPVCAIDIVKQSQYTCYAVISECRLAALPVSCLAGPLTLPFPAAAARRPRRKPFRDNPGRTALDSLMH